MPDDILGVHEMAELAGIAPRTMSAYVTRGQCPPPDYRLQCGPIWRRETAEAWIAKRDERLERIQSQTGKVIEKELRAAENYVAFQVIGATIGGKRQNAEVRYRNARNKKARGGKSQYTRILPTVRQEARMIAEAMIGRGDSSLPDSLLVRHDWAVGLLQRRQANRLGSLDGIPF